MFALLSEPGVEAGAFLRTAQFTVPENAELQFDFLDNIGNLFLQVVLGDTATFDTFQVLLLNVPPSEVLPSTLEGPVAKGFTRLTADLSSLEGRPMELFFNLTPGAFPVTGSESFGVDNISIASVPEPNTMLLLASGLAGLAGWRRKQRHTTNTS